MTPEEILQVEKEIVLTLKNIYDPEIPVNIYDLGLIYEIDYTPDGTANIRMTLTAPNCPMADILVEEVNGQVAKVKGVQAVNVILTFEPVWDKKHDVRGGIDGTQSAVRMTEQETHVLERLQQDTMRTACADYLAGADQLHRHEILTSLAFDRLRYKMELVDEIRANCGGDWNQTFYRLYFRTLGDSSNQAAYLTLAERVPYKSRCANERRLTPSKRCYWAYRDC